ncbi:endonuclease/exonuclease/phosphatase family protein [Clavibacter sp. Sh2036]|uniref:endonuclease/exonuclease/phosphatase family protein n=1 Tax=Clavibacter sp. Sh2036 TaxID=3397677 RepID=UPI0039E1D84E
MGRVVGAAVILVTAAGLLVITWPQLLGLEQSYLVAHAVAIRGALVAASAAVLALTLLLCLAIRPARRLLGSLALLLAVFIGANAAVLATRGAGDTAFADPQDADVTVLSWNTLGGATGPRAVADLAIESAADVITLPETREETGAEIAVMMRAAGRPMWVRTVAFDDVAAARSTTILISAAYGDYRLDESRGTTSVLPTVIMEPVDGNGPVIMAVHPVSPIPEQMDNWRADLAWLGQRCDEGNVIIAGDFNATLDHMSRYGGTPTERDQVTDLGQCVDAARASGNAAVGTWPTGVPALLGTPIDHIMATPGWAVTGFRVVEDRDGAGSDHRPIVAQLTPLR